MLARPAVEAHISIKVPVSDLPRSRRWYSDVFGLHEEMEWPDGKGTVGGVAFTGLGAVMVSLREPRSRGRDPQLRPFQRPGARRVGVSDH